MTERERKILIGEDIQPRTADEITYANVSGGVDEPVVIDVVTNDTFTQVISVDITPEELSAAIEAKKRIYIAPHQEDDPADTLDAVYEMALSVSGVNVASVSVMIDRLSGTLNVSKISVAWEKEGLWVARHEIKKCSIATS